MSGELLSNPHFLRGGGGDWGVILSEQGAEKMFGLRVMNREQKRKNKEQKKNK